MAKTDKKSEPKEIDPFAIAVCDSIDNGFFGDNQFKMERMIENCRKRGLVGIWTQEQLSKPLQAFEQASKEMDENQIEALLTTFATVIAFDVNLVKRHFYALRQNWEQEFLKKESGVDLFPKDTETSPSGNDEQ